MGERPNRRQVLGAQITAPKASGLARSRLSSRLDRIWDHRLGLVVAPAGCGKTTLLAQFASATGWPVGWYRAEADDSQERALVAHVARSLGDVLGIKLPDQSVRSLAGALECWPGERAVVVLDDLHLLCGTPSESAVERLVGYLPPSIKVIAASRCVPAFNLSRLRLSGSVLEIGADDLRFRAWEVESLFHECYGEPVPPDELAELTRRTEGWAAGLQLFHLATLGKTPAQRQAVLVALGSRSRLVREYLAHNVLHDLGEDLREFLLRTSVLGHLTGPLCDALLGRLGTAAVLEELERRQIFTFRVDDEGGFRYHEALRTHLDSMLVDRLGQEGVRAEHQRAGELLEGAGLATAALLAYCRAGDDDAASRLLGTDGEHVVADPGSWVEALPPAMVATDPWLQLAMARRYLGAGMLPSALETFQQAERVFGRDSGADVCREERRAAAVWHDPRPAFSDDWAAIARAATQRDPLAAMRRAGRLPGAVGRAVEGAAACLGGRFRAGRSLVGAAARMPDAGPILSDIIDVLGLLADLLAGDPEPPTEVDDAARWGRVPWLDRLARAALAGAGPVNEGQEHAALQAAARGVGDEWGRALMCLCEGLAGNRRRQPTAAALRRAADSFGVLGAAVLEAWATSALAVALARTGSPEARDVGLAAVALGTNVASWGSVALARRALVVSDPRRAQTHEQELRRLLQVHQLDAPDLPAGAGAVAEPVAAEPSSPRSGLDPVPNGPRVAGGSGAPAVVLRCFSRFEMVIEGEPVAMSALKPKARSTLRLLAMHAGRPVHRDTLLASLWPDRDPRAATRALQVVVSSLRQAVEPGAARGPYSILVREADAYGLLLPSGADADILRFRRSVAAGRAAAQRGDSAGTEAAFRSALEAYAGELLPEEGSAEWVVTERDHCRIQAADAAHGLARLLLDLDDPVGAGTVCELGLSIDRYRDELWQVLIEASDRAGRHAATQRARHHYDVVLAELA